jgi:hypothetical protein
MILLQAASYFRLIFTKLLGSIATNLPPRILEKLYDSTRIAPSNISIPLVRTCGTRYLLDIGLRPVVYDVDVTWRFSNIDQPLRILTFVASRVDIMFNLL